MSKARRQADTGSDSFVEEDDDFRSIGLDDSHNQAVSEDVEKRINEAACTEVISIRMQKSMIADLKLIAQLNKGIGYQTLMKQIIQRFIEAEMKMYFRRFANERLADEQQLEPVKAPRERKTG